MTSERRVRFPAPYEPLGDLVNENVFGAFAEERLDLWAEAMANQQRWNTRNERELRPVATAVEAAHVWSDGGIYGCTYEFYDESGHALFKVGKRADGILLCWECGAAACCGHIVEALAYWAGRNSVEGAVPHG